MLSCLIAKYFFEILSEKQLKYVVSSPSSCSLFVLKMSAIQHLCTYNFSNPFLSPPTGSPFKVGITDEIRPEKVRCFGPGIEPEGVRKGNPAKFTVDTTGAGQAPLDVSVTDKTGG